MPAHLRRTKRPNSAAVCTHLTKSRYQISKLTNKSRTYQAVIEADTSSGSATSRRCFTPDPGYLLSRERKLSAKGYRSPTSRAINEFGRQQRAFETLDDSTYHHRLT